MYLCCSHPPGHLRLVTLACLHGPCHLPAAGAGEETSLQARGSPSRAGGGRLGVDGGEEAGRAGAPAAGTREAQQGPTEGLAATHLCGPHHHPLCTGGGLHDRPVRAVRLPPGATLQV